ncbi:MAG: amino acid kinase family protein [Methanotrichaceae archaeon]
MPFCVVKIGGSLLGYSQEIVRKLVGLTSNGYSFLVVPGGGPMADVVRDLFQRYEISQDAAHWMAILAMEQYAYFMADDTSAKLTNEIRTFSSGVYILLPYRALLADDTGIEHTWDYTSDAVAALAACRLGIDLVKATNVDGVILDEKVVSEISAEELMGRQTCVDQGALHVLNQCGGRCLVLNGTDPDRLLANIIRRKSGTLIRGQNPGREGSDLKGSFV